MGKKVLDANVYREKIREIRGNENSENQRLINVARMSPEKRNELIKRNKARRADKKLKLEKFQEEHISSINYYLVSNIQKLCEVKDMSIRELERLLDISNGSIKKWETTFPSIDKVSQISNFFQITIDALISGDLFETEHNSKSQEVIYDLQMSLNQHILTYGNHLLDDHQKQALKTLMEAFLPDDNKKED